MATKQTTKGMAVFGKFEPSLAYQFLPGCPACAAPHPLARKRKPVDIEHCPDCGADVAPPGEVRVEKAALNLRNTPGIMWGKFCLWAGDRLNKFNERLF